jgi:hypothetical protein
MSSGRKYGTSYFITVLCPTFLVILLVAGNIGGMETTGKIHQIEVTENSLFY